VFTARLSHLVNISKETADLDLEVFNAFVRDVSAESVV
jgi:hypothetical protein